MRAPLLGLLALLALCACAAPAPPPAATRRPAATPAATSAPPTATPLALRIPDLRQAWRLSVTDDWDGLSDYAPTRRSFTWERTPGGYAGQGTLSVGGQECDQQAGRASSTISAEELDALAELLMGAQIAHEGYAAVVVHTDDYPSKRLRFDLADGSVYFFSRSQGDGYTPWGVSFGSRDYTLIGDAPYQALLRLRGAMGDDVFEALMRRCDAARPGR